jgi:Short C-terminal domain
VTSSEGSDDVPLGGAGGPGVDGPEMSSAPSAKEQKRQARGEAKELKQQEKVAKQQEHDAAINAATEAMAGFGKKVPRPVIEAAARLSISDPVKYYMRFKLKGPGGGVAGIFVTADTIFYGPHKLPLAGARATVDTSGNTALAQGWVVKERTDTRQLFLTVEATGGGFAIKLPPEMEGSARSLAAYVNSHAGPVVSEPAKSAPEVDFAEQIRKIAELRDQGILTEEEFTAKKAELLAKM